MPWPSRYTWAYGIGVVGLLLIMRYGRAMMRLTDDPSVRLVVVSPVLRFLAAGASVLMRFSRTR